MTLLLSQSRFAARNGSLSATGNIGPAFQILKFALSGYLLSEGTQLFPKTIGPNPTRASSWVISKPASRSGLELCCYGTSKEGGLGGNHCFSTWEAFEKNWCAHHHSAQSAK